MIVVFYVYKHELKVTVYFLNGCTYFPCAPTSLATYLPWEEKKKKIVKNERCLDLLRCKEMFVYLSNVKLKSDDCRVPSHNLFTLAQVSKDQKAKDRWKFHVSCPRPKLQVYPKQNGWKLELSSPEFADRHRLVDPNKIILDIWIYL